jgi:hypothetical protein
MKKAARGDDGGKNVSSRKRHLLGDTTGLLRVVVHPANILDQVGGDWSWLGSLNGPRA